MNREIKFRVKNYHFHGDDYSIDGNKEYWLLKYYDGLIYSFLNDKVEILEEYEDIEELENYPDVLDWKEEYGIDRALKEQSEFNEIVFNRLNELAKEVNKLRKDKQNCLFFILWYNNRR